MADRHRSCSRRTRRRARGACRLAGPILGLLAAGCARPAPLPAPAPGQPSRTATVSAGPLEDVFLLSGEIEAVRSVEFAAPRSNGETRIQWLADDGGEVRAGDVVIAYDASAVTSTLEDKRLRLAQAEIELDARSRASVADVQGKRAAAQGAEIAWKQARLQADVPAEFQARREWQEKQNALRRAEAALEKARLETRAAEAAARADVGGARAALDKTRRDLADAESTLAGLRVRAPRDGIFIVRDHWSRAEGRKYQAGDGVFMGQPVASLPDLDELQVGARLAAVDEGRIAAGQPARCILDTYPETPIACRVAELSAVAEEKPAPGFRVRLTLEAVDRERLRPGMSVRVEVVRRRFERALRVPREALARDGERVFARLPGGGRSEVRLEACTPTACVLASGLSEGQLVALP